MTIITKDRDDFLKAIGAAVEAYAEVEASQARLLQCILDVDSMQAATIFFTVQNVRSRNDLFASLIEHKYGDAHSKFWKSCSAFLLDLSKFRNAIVHWHPMTMVYVNRDPAKVPKAAARAIRNPMPGRRGSLTLDAFSPFMLDCTYIRAEMDQFSGYLRDPAEADDPTLPERFSLPLPRQNLALLQPSQSPKGPPSRPQSLRGSPQSR
jgi:hypothetical protein